MFKLSNYKLYFVPRLLPLSLHVQPVIMPEEP